MFHFIILILLSYPGYARKAEPAATNQSSGAVSCKSSAVGALADQQLNSVKRALVQRLKKLETSKNDSRQAFLLKRGLQNVSFLNTYHGSSNSNPSQDVSQFSESMKALF